MYLAGISDLNSWGLLSHSAWGPWELDFMGFLKLVWREPRTDLGFHHTWGRTCRATSGLQNHVLFGLTARLGQHRALRAACPHGRRGAGVSAAGVPSAQLLVPFQGVDTPASATLAPSPWPGQTAPGFLLPSCLPPETKHFSSISTDLGLIWVASVYRLCSLLHNASVTAVLSSYHQDVNVFTRRSLDTC